MSNLKLGVLVVSAHDLIVPKDGQGAASAFVELHFDNQTFQTVTKERDANPVWDQSFYFNISDPKCLRNLTLEAHVYHLKGDNSKSLLGKVFVSGRSLFVPYSDALALQHHPLQKRGILFNSRAKGELGLKVFVTDRDGHHLPNPRIAQQQPSMNSGMHDEIESEQSEPEADSKPESSTDDAVESSTDDADDAVESSSDTSPYLGRGQIVQGLSVPGDSRDVSSYHLVETMQYLFVRVVKARLDLLSNSVDVTGSIDPYVEVKVGKNKGITRHFEKQQNPVWDEVFAFAKDNLQSSKLDVVVKDKDLFENDQSFGSVQFDLMKVPARLPPDSQLALNWYQIVDHKDVDKKKKGELMLAVWYGTQADKAFPDAWRCDGILPPEVSYHQICSKVYHSPRLWYVRVEVIEAQDLVVSDKSRIPDAYTKVLIGNQCLKTKTAQSRTLNPMWNEEVMVVAAEPFDTDLIVSVEDYVGPDKFETLGRIAITLNSVERRADDDQTIHAQWFNLEKSMSDTIEKDKNHNFSSRIRLRVCLEGGYHVLEESINCSSDLQPADKQLWKPYIGVLELEIINASELPAMKTREGKGTSDPYCVARYGNKWVRTRTIIDSLNPKYKEQHTWEVYDPATFLKVGIFDNRQIGNSNGSKDAAMGKIRIRISDLESGHVYKLSYPLLSLHTSGMKKMGELHLAVRFSCTSLVNMALKYSQPLLPKMHYMRPLTVTQEDMLHGEAVLMVAAGFGQAEPPLTREVVQYMYDAEVDAHWSMRRSKAHIFRCMNVISLLIAVGKWFSEVCMWKSPITTALVHVLFVMLVSTPELILSTVFLYMFVSGSWYFWCRPRHPPHLDTRLSHADYVSRDELDEEFDTYPSSQASDKVRMRYDRLRSLAGRLQTVMDNVVMQGERIQEILSWRDPRATTLFVAFCLVAAILVCVTPFKVVVVLVGFYFMRHPKFRGQLSSAPVNFFRRLPGRT